MAVARPPAAAGATGLKVALIVLVCVTLASLTFMVILYTHQEDLDRRATQATDDTNRANTQRREALDSLGDFALEVTGERMEDAAAITRAIATARDGVLGDGRLQQAGMADKPALLTLLKDLHALYVKQAAALAEITAARDGLNERLAKLTKAEEDRAAEFKTKMDELQGKYDQLAAQTEELRTAWNNEVAQLRKQLDQASSSAGDQLNDERRARLDADKKLAELQKQNKQLLQELASFKPSADVQGVLQVADGKIVRAVVGEDIVYISLGRKDQVSRGLRFGVYSSVKGIPPGGESKAGIEVVDVFDTTSECRIVEKKPGEPILEGDLIANAVYDRSRRFNFMVVGDFDLDFDGTVDDPGGEKVTTLIKGWGGSVVSEMDTRTDFLVRGEAPPLPKKPGQEGEVEADANQTERDKEAVARHAAFQAALKRAQELSVPVLTRTQFLQFVGLGAAEQRGDDSLTAGNARPSARGTNGEHIVLQP